ncbi:MAG: hypothetical protein ACYC8T_10330 [Myxococcaceae bacterium]
MPTLACGGGEELGLLRLLVDLGLLGALCSSANQRPPPPPALRR